MVSALPGLPLGDDGDEQPRPKPAAVPERARVFSKGSLVALAHGIEASLLDAEPDPGDLPVVIALFQREQYFAPERRRYRAIARNSLATLVGFVDEDPDVPTPIIGMPLKAGEALSKEFCLVIISKCICVSLIGVENGSSRGVEERARRFETRWSFDRIRAVQEARRLIDELGDRVPHALGDQIAQRLHDAEQAVPRRIEARLTASFEQMVKRYQWVASRVSELEDANERLSATPDDDAPIATIERDEVTEVGNRNTLARFFGELMIDASTPRVAVAWLDIDDLDAINAQHGRGAGDMALKVVAETIASQVREEDCFVRWGDDEFVVVMPGMDIGAAKRRALELVEAVSWKAFPEPYRGVNLTVSCGVAVGDLPAIELERLRDTVNRGRGGNRGRTIVGDYLTTT